MVFTIYPVHEFFCKFCFLSAMSLRCTSKDLNSCPPPPPLLSDKILTKASIPSDSNKLAYFNSVNKEFLPKNPPQKILPKNPPKIFSQKIPPK